MQERKYSFQRGKEWKAILCNDGTASKSSGEGRAKSQRKQKDVYLIHPGELPRTGAGGKCPDVPGYQKQ